jgi:cell division protein FtsQ
VSSAPAPRRGLPTGSASVADKRFRRTDVRPARRRRVLQRVWQVGRVMGVVLVLAGLGAFASTRVVGARMLAVADVTVRGNHRLTLAEIEALIGDVRGESLLLVDLGRFRAKLLDSRWVADVTIRRVFPSGVDVRIIEREPVAVARLGQQLYLIDESGLIIDEYGPQYKDFDLPIVDGLAAPRSVDGPVIDAGRARLTAQFLRSLAPRPELIRALSQVDMSTAGNVVVLLGDDPTYLHLGDEMFLERIQTYLELTPTLADRETPIDYVDLRFGNRVFLKDRK